MVDGPPSTAAGRSPVGRAAVRFARRGSASLTYEAIGPTDAHVVAMLHDLLGDRSSFAPLRDALLAAGYRAISPDLRGHGASAALSTRPYPMADLGADVLTILDAEAVERAHLIGHGLGGAIALAIACATPRRVASVTLLAPSVAGLLEGAPDSSHRRAAAEERLAAESVAALATKGLTDQALDAWFDSRMGTGWRERLPRQRLAAIRRQAGALGPILAARETHAPLPVVLARCEVPTFVVATDGEPSMETAVRQGLVTALPVSSEQHVSGAATVGDVLADPAHWLTLLLAALADAEVKRRVVLE